MHDATKKTVDLLDRLASRKSTFYKQINIGPTNLDVDHTFTLSNGWVFPLRIAKFEKRWRAIHPSNGKYLPLELDSLVEQPCYTHENASRIGQPWHRIKSSIPQIAQRGMQLCDMSQSSKLIIPSDITGFTAPKLIHFCSISVSHLHNGTFW